MRKSLNYVLDVYTDEEIDDALFMALMLKDDDEKAVGILSNILSYKTPDILVQDGFSQDVVNAVETLVKKPREGWKKYVERVKGDTLSSYVLHIRLLKKISDLETAATLTQVKKKELSQYEEMLMALFSKEEV